MLVEGATQDLAGLVARHCVDELDVAWTFEAREVASITSSAAMASDGGS